MVRQPLLALKWPTSLTFPFLADGGGTADRPAPHASALRRALIEFNSELRPKLKAWDC